MTNGEAFAGTEVESMYLDEKGSWIREESRATNVKHEYLAVHPSPLSRQL